jgi:mono/diheme cytochrome c family protein
MRTYLSGRTILIVLLVELVVALVVLAAMTLGGVYDVAASRPHLAVTRAVLSAIMDSSVRHHAAGIAVSPVYNVPDLAEGAEHYREMCAVCHGAPGERQSEISKGLNPHAPYLVRSVRDMKPAEVYWLIRNGVKMTGMPAFGKTHTDEQMWAIAAFVKRLPNMTPEQYRGYAAAERPEHSAEPHEATGEGEPSESTGHSR